MYDGSPAIFPGVRRPLKRPRYTRTVLWCPGEHRESSPAPRQRDVSGFELEYYSNDV